MWDIEYRKPVTKGWCIISHVVAIKTKLRDLVAINAACKRLGGTLHLGQKTYKWYGHWMNDYDQEDAGYKQGIKTEDYGKCNHAISMPGTQYQAGLVKQEDGYTLIFDFIDAGLSRALGGKEAHNFLQAYAVEKAKIEARKKGFTATEQTMTDGSIKVVLTGG